MLRKKIIKGVLIIFFFLCILLVGIFLQPFKIQTTAKTANPEQPIKAKEQRVSLIFVGDIMFHKSQIKAANSGGKNYDFSHSFSYISPILKSADFTAGNLETTFGGEPYSGFPAFSAPDTVAWFLKQAGFNVITTANNHSSDKGYRGLSGTNTALDRNNFIHTGIFTNEESKEKNSPVYLVKNGIKIALLNYTYGTNNNSSKLLINKIDTVTMAKDIEKANNNLSDAIIVSLHWGNEYKRHPDQFQKKIAVFLFRQGVNAVIGSHPHVIQGFERRIKSYGKDSTLSICVYSLGNFISNQRWRYSDGGLLVKFDIVKKVATKSYCTVENFVYDPCWVHTYYIGKKKYYDVLPSSLVENDSTKKQELKSDYIKYKQFVEDTKELMDNQVDSN